MIEVEGLHKTFGDVVAVDDVTFTAPDGEITGLLGPNGAGKTTTLRMLYGVLAPERGTARVDGVSVAEAREEVLARIGALPHAHGLYTRLTPREHVRYFGELRGMAGPELERRIDELIELLELGELERRCSGFSRGESVKVALARAIVHDPPNLILDEPTTGLDVMSSRNVRGLIRRLRDEGRCVVFSSHLMHEVAELCDNIVIVARGRVVASGSADQLRTQTGCADLEDAFVAAIGTDEGLMR
jgi:sodium transport system ATP-binding protein